MIPARIARPHALLRELELIVPTQSNPLPDYEAFIFEPRSFALISDSVA